MACTPKDSFIVYRSFFDAIEPLSEADQLALLKQIFEFGLNHKEVDLEPLPKAMFSLIKPQLEANHKRWVNGNKGGRPKTSKEEKITKEKPNSNQTVTTPKPNKNKNKNKNKNNENFEKFWSNYPKKTDKKKALLSFCRLNEINQNLAIDDCGLRYSDTDKKFIPHATTYINGERWEDEKEGDNDKNANFWGNLK